MSAAEMISRHRAIAAELLKYGSPKHPAEMRELAQALADLEAATEARVRAGLLSAVSSLVGSKEPGKSREETERALFARLQAARNQCPYPCAAATKEEPADGKA